MVAILFHKRHSVWKLKHAKFQCKCQMHYVFVISLTLPPSCRFMPLCVCVCIQLIFPIRFGFHVPIVGTFRKTILKFYTPENFDWAIHSFSKRQLTQRTQWHLVILSKLSSGTVCLFLLHLHLHLDSNLRLNLWFSIPTKGGSSALIDLYFRCKQIICVQLLCWPNGHGNNNNITITESLKSAATFLGLIISQTKSIIQISFEVILQVRNEHFANMCTGPVFLFFYQMQCTMDELFKTFYAQISTFRQKPPIWEYMHVFTAQKRFGWFFFVLFFVFQLGVAHTDTSK